MRFSPRALALVPLCAVAMLAAAPPPFAIDRGPVTANTLGPTRDPARAMPATRAPIAHAAPADPPDGTYTYDLLRNGTVQGTTTVALYRRAERDAIETDEAGHFGAATLSAIGSFAFADLATQHYVATYRAPFPHNVPLGRVDAMRPHVAFDAPTTVRYDVDATSVRATVDGVASDYLLPASAPGTVKHTPFVIDAPFLTSVLLLPAFRQRMHANDLAWYSLAFPQTPDDASSLAAAPIRRVETPARFPKTPKTAIALAIAGLGTIWFDRGNGIVYEAHFDGLNADANLVSYKRAVDVPAGDEPAPLPSPTHIASQAVRIGDGDSALAGVVNLPATTGSPLPAVVLVPPGPSGDRNFDASGPEPMYVDLAIALTARGFAVLRYDPRGSRTGKQTAKDVTWDEARADASAAVGFAQSNADIDPARVFVLGYGNGADLAFAAAAATSDDPIAGIVALAPTTMKYETCDRRIGIDVAHPTAWERSTFGHDPSQFAVRAKLPLFVLQPGVPVCPETASELAAYDDALRAANPAATIVVASDLSKFFGGRYDADSNADTRMFFPYRFDASTLGAIADWIAGPHNAVAPLPDAGGSGSTSVHRPPPPPRGLPQDRSTAAPEVQPGQLTIPSYPPVGTPPPATSPAPSAS
jgi:dienelactone hydrolase